MGVIRDVRSLSTTPGFLKILGVRLLSQSGDGMFQAGLASLFFFRPETMTDAYGVAAAIVVLMLPYSLVGPFVGPILDSVRRRQVLLWGNIARFVLVAFVAVCLVAFGVGLPVYVGALVVLGLARFMMAGLSAALPRVVRNDELLVTANSIVPTIGGVSAGVGMVCGFLLRLFVPAGTLQDVGALVIAGVLYVCAAAMALVVGRDELGPDIPTQHRSHSRVLVGDMARAGRDLWDAVRYLAKRGTPAAALGVMAAHRFVYGVQLVTIILMSRNFFAEPHDAEAGLAVFGVLFGALAAGYVAAVVITPLAHARIRPAAWMVVSLLGGALGQVALVVSADMTVMSVALFVFGVGGQGTKIAVDSIVQAETADEYRGRAFALYDVLFNVSESLAAVVCIAVLPSDGYSPLVQGFLLVFIVVLASAWRVYSRQR